MTSVWSVRLAMTALALMIVVSTILSGVVVVAFETPIDSMDISDPKVLLFVVLANCIGVFSGLVYAFRAIGPTAFQWSPCSREDAAWAVAMVVPSFGIGNLIAIVAGYLGVHSEPQMIVEAMLTTTSLPALIGTLAYAIVGASILEEALFRGVVQPAFVHRFGVVSGIAVTSVLFGLVHMADVWVVVPLIMVGAIAGWLRHRTGGLGAPILFHAAHNAVAFGFTVMAT